MKSAADDTEIGFWQCGQRICMQDPARNRHYKWWFSRGKIDQFLLVRRFPGGAGFFGFSVLR